MNKKWDITLSPLPKPIKKMGKYEQILELILIIIIVVIIWIFLFPIQAQQQKTFSVALQKQNRVQFGKNMHFNDRIPEERNEVELKRAFEEEDENEEEVTGVPSFFPPSLPPSSSSLSFFFPWISSFQLWCTSLWLSVFLCANWIYVGQFVMSY